MARKKKNAGKVETKDYRHTDEKRKNIPPAKIASEGKIPAVNKKKYFYSPHLDPEIRFDPTGMTDRLSRLREKVEQNLSKEELELIDAIINNNQPCLEWAGKKEEHDLGYFEVDPVALHIHERVSANAIIRAALREDAQRDLFADPQLDYQEAVKFYQHDIDWANRLILGDSLQVMSSLSKREKLAGKIQTIYMDPPYGINYRSNFQPQIKNRDVSEKEVDLARELETVKAYRDTWNLGVSSYLSYLRQRLILSRELLSPTGSIFIQISNDNMHRVRLILDEIFGAKNCIATIVCKKGAPQSRTIKNAFNYLLWYCRDLNQVKVNKVFRERKVGDGTTEDPKKLALWLQLPNGEERPLTTEEKREQVDLPEGSKVFRIGDVRSRGSDENKNFPIFINGENILPGLGFIWRGNPEQMDRLVRSGRIIKTRDTLGYKFLLGDSAGIEITNLWDDTAGKIPEMVFAVQTNEKIVSRCILMSSDPGDLVLDPTCGSGTTPFLAEKWGRRWITIDTSRVALAIAKQRIVTANFDYYEMENEEFGINNGLKYKLIPRITRKTIADNENLNPILDRYDNIFNTYINSANEVLEKTNADIKKKLGIASNKFEHWTLPLEGKKEWPNELNTAINNYRNANLEKMDNINECISQNADHEILLEQPIIQSGILRVSGPFTVEGVFQEEFSLGDGGTLESTSVDWNSQVIEPKGESQNIQAYLSRMVDLIQKDGVTYPNNNHQDFGRVDALYHETTGTTIHAEGIWDDNDVNETNNIAIAFGPQFGPVTAYQVEDIIRASRRYDEVIIAGFSFDGAAAAAIQESQHPKLKVHMTHIRPDVSPGMTGLLKDTPNSQLFSVFGQPEIEINKGDNGEILVALKGVDIYDPLKGEIKSTGAEKVAAWFLDRDYDGRCFCITQAFFPNQKAWDKIAKSLGSSADPEAFETFKGTVSLPFKPGEFNRVAVKVIDPRGNEVMTIADLKGVV